LRVSEAITKLNTYQGKDREARFRSVVAALGSNDSRQEAAMAEKTLTPSDLKKQARELLRTGKMPSPEQFAEAMNEARQGYAPKIKKANRPANRCGRNS
jgi:hypothetical protein